MNIKNYISLILRAIIAIIFLQTLYFKFTAHPESVYIFSQLGVEPYGRISLGIIELITAVLIFIPKTKLYGIGLSFGIILGAIFSHLLVIGLTINGDGGSLFILALVVLISTLILSILHTREIMAIIDRWRK